MAIPYEKATSGTRAREETIKYLRQFGCESVGFMDEFETKTLILQFKWKGIPVTLRANAAGWAAAWLKENPYNPSRHRKSKNAYEAQALAQGVLAVNSIIRDWVKGQVTAVETGILTFEHVFMPYMQLENGQTLLEFVKDKQLLPAPDSEAE